MKKIKDKTIKDLAELVVKGKGGYLLKINKKNNLFPQMGIPTQKIVKTQDDGVMAILKQKAS